MIIRTRTLFPSHVSRELTQQKFLGPGLEPTPEMPPFGLLRTLRAPSSPQ